MLYPKDIVSKKSLTIPIYFFFFYDIWLEKGSVIHFQDSSLCKTSLREQCLFNPHQ